MDATVALLAASGDRILTSYPGDLGRLTAGAQSGAVIVPANNCEHTVGGIL
jgi:hypothetical protein